MWVFERKIGYNSACIGDMLKRQILLPMWFLGSGNVMVSFKLDSNRPVAMQRKFFAYCHSSLASVVTYKEGRASRWAVPRILVVTERPGNDDMTKTFASCHSFTCAVTERIVSLTG